ncbi:MAG: hypothetical protein MRQ07_05150 [Candidatus Midichloria sp.]|nr:hypothetical protein [Candidatus Midichloria sp.]
MKFEVKGDFILVIEEEIQELEKHNNLAESKYGKFLLKSHDKLKPNKYHEAVDLIINGDKVLD